MAQYWQYRCVFSNAIQPVVVNASKLTQTKTNQRADE